MKTFFSALAYIKKNVWGFALGLSALFILLWMTCGEYVTPFWTTTFAVLGIGGFLITWACLYFFSKKKD